MSDERRDSPTVAELEAMERLRHTNPGDTETQLLHAAGFWSTPTDLAPEDAAKLLEAVPGCGKVAGTGFKHGRAMAWAAGYTSAGGKEFEPCSACALLLYRAIKGAEPGDVMIEYRKPPEGK